LKAELRTPDDGFHPATQVSPVRGTCHRFRPLGEERVFERIFQLLASDADNEYMMINATIVRAHQHSAGAQKKTAAKLSADRAAD
jgi:hypothetical protein